MLPLTLILAPALKSRPIWAKDGVGSTLQRVADH